MIQWHPDADKELFPARGKPWVGGSGRRKLVLHTIEANGWPNYEAPPHLTLNPIGRELRQHVPFDKAAYALRFNDGEDDRYTWQIELWGRAANTPDYPDEWYRGVAEQVAWFVMNMGVRHIYADFSEMRYGINAPQRMSHEETDAFQGILGHAHWGKGVDSHWDPGRINVGKLSRYVEEEIVSDKYKETSQPGFQVAWDKAIDYGMYSEHTLPSDIVLCETNAVFLDRVGFFEYGQRITDLEARVRELEVTGGIEPHTHETGGPIV